MHCGGPARDSHDFQALLPAIEPALRPGDAIGIFETQLEPRACVSGNPPATKANFGIIQPVFQRAGRHPCQLKTRRDWISGLERSERQRTGNKTLKWVFNKVFGYYLEISRGMADQAPENYIRKQTLVNNERFITPELKEYESLVLNAEAQIHEVELRVYKQVCAQLASSSSELLNAARAIAKLGLLLSFGSVAALINTPDPDSTQRRTEDHRRTSSVVERMRSETRYIPNDVLFEDGEDRAPHYRPQHER